jgi:hypothetical protein
MKPDLERFEDLCERHGLPSYDLDAAMAAAEDRLQEAHSIRDEIRRICARLEV